MQKPKSSGMTEQEQQVYMRFQSEARKHLKTMSKNDLVKTCIALIVDNYGLKSALEKKNENPPT